MPTQRPARSHLPSYSGDYTNEARAWRPPSFGRGIDLKGVTDVDEEDVKSILTTLRVWTASVFHLTGSSARHGLRGKASPSVTRRVLFLGICLVILLFWSSFKPNSTTKSVQIPQFETRETPAPEMTKQRFRAASHTYRFDGLLEVNPNGTHPIFDLISKAEAAWHSKLRKASSTFPEAIEEYVRRYHRPPPKGFDKWWEYVQENKVQLPDEYDVINERLEPFWGIRPLDLRRIMADWEDRSDVPVMVFGKSTGKPIRILKSGMPEAQADMFEEALRDRLTILLDVEDDLPEFRAIISPGDTPNLLKDWELIQEARDAARKGSFIDIDGPPPIKHGWLSACEPHTPAHKRPLDFYASVSPDLLHKKKKTFIHDHRATMNPCFHPELLFTSGQFLSHYEGPSSHRVLIPQFSSSTTLLHYDLLPIPPSGWGEERRDTPWEHKYDERLLWRGVNTGMMCTPNTHWRQSQRFRLVELADSVHGEITVLPPPKQGEETIQVGEGVKWSKARVNPAMLDVAFAGSPVQCEEPTCEELRTQFDWRKRMDTQESARYKYVIDVDGNGWSSRFKRLMASNSLIFKSTVYPEWFIDRIQPWVHYVPIGYDYSDLYDAFVFFRGDITGAGNHDELAKKIALAGSNWASTFWRPEDATAYMFRLLLEYARVINLDRDAMSMNLAEYGL